MIGREMGGAGASPNMDQGAIAKLEKELQWKRVKRGLEQPPIDEFMLFIGSRLDRNGESLLTHFGQHE